MRSKRDLSLARDSAGMASRNAVAELAWQRSAPRSSDSGPGIPDHRLNEVFDTFYTTKEQGTGLGLTVARTIIEKYDGKIWAENQAGGGAVFRVTLPLIR
jgi:K+-sensing histidine kinase KdpD